MEYVIYKKDELYHWGIKGMKWGIRRYQNKDGSLTAAGKKRKNTSDNDSPQDRDVQKLSSLSANKNTKLHPNDRSHFGWDIEGTDEAHYNEKLSSKNPEHVKKIVKELDEYWKRTIKEAAEYDYCDDSKRYYDTYVKNNKEAYAKAVLEEVEYWRNEREKAYHSDVDNAELYHHGILGMKWGVRRYQNKDGSLTAAGQKRYADKMAKIEAKTQKLRNKQEVAAKKKAIKDAQQNLRDMRKGKKAGSESEDVDIEAKKAKILESRSAKALYDNANLFSFQELNAAKMRLELERNIKNMEPATISKGKAAANRFTESADTLSNILQSGSKAYNNMARVFNSLYGNKKGLSLPLITDNTKSKLDKFKEETDWIDAKNKRKKAEEEAGEKKKTALEKLQDETEMIRAQNKNREVKRTREQLDKEDADKAAKQKKDADDAAKKAQRDKDMEDYNNFQEQYKKSTDLPESGPSSTYRNAGVDGSRTNVNPNNARGLSSGNTPLGLPSGTSDRTYSSVSNDPSTSSGRNTVQRLLGTDYGSKDVVDLGYVDYEIIE